MQWLVWPLSLDAEGRPKTTTSAFEAVRQRLEAMFTPRLPWSSLPSGGLHLSAKVPDFCKAKAEIGDRLRTQLAHIVDITRIEFEARAGGDRVVLFVEGRLRGREEESQWNVDLKTDPQTESLALAAD